MLKHTVTLHKITNGEQTSYKLGNVEITLDAYLNVLRHAQTTKVNSNELHRIRNRPVGLHLELSATGVPQELITGLTTSPAQEEVAPTEDQAPDTHSVAQTED